MSQDNTNIRSDFWVGVVEDNSNDPMRIGRCRVRIIGTHDFDSTQVPVQTLPWVQPVLPLGSNSFSVPNVNDWVTGYYLDGENKQIPVMTGVLPGIVNKATYVKLTGREQQEYLKKLQSQAVPLIEPEPAIGQPTIAAAARGDVANTSVVTTNDNRGHACSAALFVRRTMAQAKIEASSLIRSIRTAIVSALNSIGTSPVFAGIKAAFEKIKDTLENINEFLNDVIIEIAKLVEVVQQIRAIIEYILSLPEKLIELFRRCLNEIYAELSRGAFELVAGVITEASVDLDINIEPLVATINETKTLLENAAVIISSPAQLVDALITPSGLTEEQKKELTQEIFPSVVEFDRNNFQGL
jgi:hypothetical protein